MNGISDKIGAVKDGIFNKAKEILEHRDSRVKAIAGIGLIAFATIALLTMNHDIDFFSFSDKSLGQIVSTLAIPFSIVVGGGFIYYLLDQASKKKENRKAQKNYEVAKTVIKVLLMTFAATCVFGMLVSTGTFNFIDKPSWSSAMGLAIPVVAGAVGVASLLFMTKMNLTFAKLFAVQSFVSYLVCWALMCTNFAIMTQTDSTYCMGLVATVIGGGLVGITMLWSTEKVLRAKERKNAQDQAQLHGQKRCKAKAKPVEVHAGDARRA